MQNATGGVLMIKSKNAEHVRCFFEQGLIDGESYSRNRTNEIRKVLEVACDLVNESDKSMNMFRSGKRYVLISLVSLDNLKQALLKAGCVDE